jgi:hypothetical protein
MSNSLPRWVQAKTSNNAHLDLGQRSSQSRLVYADHVIVTACHAHLAADAIVVEQSYQPKCSNCLRLLRDQTTPKIVPDFVKNWQLYAAGPRGLVLA